MIPVHWWPSSRQLRQFSVIALIGFTILGFVVRYWTGSTTAATVLWTLAVASPLIGLPFPSAIRPLYIVLMAISFPIGWLVSNLLLRVLFYGVLTLFGLLQRAFSRDPLNLSRPSTTTYWQKRDINRDLTSYFHQS